VATGGPAFALTGNDLLAQCVGGSDTAELKQCQNYILGVVDGVKTLGTSMRLLHPGSVSYPKLFCADNATPDELIGATKAYLLKNPNSRQFNAASEVMLALRQAFPCPK